MSEPIKLWEHQQKAVEKARGKSGFALFFSMGTGKTATTINIVRELYKKEKRLLKTLILCPPIVVNNWKREFGIHSKIKAQDIVCLTGSGKKRLEALLKIEGGNIVITNYEALLMKDVFLALKKWSPEILVCDEVHRLKNPSAKRTKLAKDLSDIARYKYILTGTPILNTPMDLFSQYRILDGGKTFGKNFYAFRATYFFDKNAYMPRHIHFPNWEIKPNAIAEIKEKLEETSMAIKKEECLTLPPLVRKTIYVELGKEQRAAYESMKRDFIAYVGSEACAANLAITKALRMQQILSGHMPVGDGGDMKLIRFKENPRLEATKELIQEITAHSKLLIWGIFKEDFKQLGGLCAELKIGYVEIHGDISYNKKIEAVEKFDTDENIRVLFGHPASGGIGISLIRASYTLFYSRGFSFEQAEQATSRNHRSGSEIHSKITQIDLVAEGTIDELILKRLDQKQAIGESLLRDIAKELQK